MQLVYPQKHQSFIPSKFELTVMDFYKILWNIMIKQVFSYKMICFDLILIFYKAIYSTKSDIRRWV